MLLNDCKILINRTINNGLIFNKLSIFFDYFNNDEEVLVEKNNDVYTVVQSNNKLMLDINNKGIRAMVDIKKKERILKELFVYKDSENLIVVYNSSVSKLHGEFISNEVSAKKITYNEHDIAILSEYKRYLPDSLETKADVDKLLEVPRAAFENSLWHDKYELYKRIERKFYDVALLTIDGNHKRIFNGIVPLSNQNYQELVIDLFIYKRLNNIEIDPWDKDEVFAFLDRYEGKVKEGLIKFSKGRLKYSYRSEKDENYYYDNKTDIDFIKE